MTYYELYINDILCDLSSDNYISLVYQSPIFSGLDIIQSNRSYNIDLPLTPKNRKAIGYAERTDIYTDAPYVKLPARLYQEGVPLFTSGYAVITEISDVISVVLTWGNVDNFQSLFDANLRDLAQTLYSMNIGSIPWNSASALLEYGYDRPQMGFFGIDFGQGIANPEYMHPSIEVQDVLTAIERYNGITIDGKERLYGGLTHPLLLPLVSKNGNEESGKAETTICKLSQTTFNGHTILKGAAPTQHPEYVSGEYFDVKNAQGVSMVIQISGFLRSSNIEDMRGLKIYIASSDDYNTSIANIGFSGMQESDRIYIYCDTNIDIPQDKVPKSGYIVIVVKHTKPVDFSGDISFYAYPREEVNFPSIFPIAVNLPDISQGDFLSALMSMAGLFAYPDKDAPDTIKLISVDDIYAKLTNGGTIDWSRKVILNDRHDVSRPESSIFSLDDLAQKNTLDYDNDDDVITDTAGEIRIENVNIDKENELVELPFSASENAPLASDANALCARIPMYTTSDDGKTVDYNEPSARILQAIIDDTSTGLYWFGYFGENMRFGGENGIVAKKYNGYQKAVDKLRLITVKAKLTAIDLHNLDYTKPIYIGQFGHTYGLYSVETGENGICECQLIQLQAIKEVVVPDYYLTINGSASDIAGTEQTTVTKQIALTASEPPIEGRNLHVVLSIEDADGSPLAADKVTVTTKDAAGQTVTREYTNTSAVDDTIADIPTSGSSVTVTASKSGYNDGWIQGFIPSGSSDYTYTGVVPLRSSRTVGADILVRDAKGSPVVADEIACTYLQSSGKTNTIRTTNSSHLDYGGYSDCSVKAFTSRITVTAADYADAVEEVPVEAGAEAVTIRKTVTLSPGSRSLHLDFAVRNEQGAAVEDAVVIIQYMKPDGSDENLQFTGGVHETFNNATTQGFTLLIMAQAEGSRMHMQEIAVPAGKEAYTYDTDVVLYYDYSPGITLNPPSPWTYTAHLGTFRNTGNVDLELLSAPEWCTITGDIPGTVAVGKGRALAVSKNETGGLRTGTISMRYRNVESSEDVTYDVEVSQEP